MVGVSRRHYGKMHGVDESAIRKAIRQGSVFLHPDNTVDVAASDEVWGRWHASNVARRQPMTLDPQTDARIDAALARTDEAWAWLPNRPRLTAERNAPAPGQGKQLTRSLCGRGHGAQPHHALSGNENAPAIGLAYSL